MHEERLDPNAFGLNYNYFRNYNPATGSYIEADRIGIQKGRNRLYIYAGNNPLMNKDPRGLVWHGKYCSPNWTGGVIEPYDPNHEDQYAEPLDPLDGCCRLHDIDYYQCRKGQPCDINARGKCMIVADGALSACASAAGGKDSGKIGWYMSLGAIPDVGPNDPSCPCKK